MHYLKKFFIIGIIVVFLIPWIVWFISANREKSDKNRDRQPQNETAIKSRQGGRVVWGPEINVFEIDIADPLQAPQEKETVIMPQSILPPRDSSSGLIVPHTPSRVPGLEDWRPLLLASGLLRPGELTNLQDYNQIEAYVKKFLDYQVLKGAISADEAIQAKQTLTVRYDQLRKGTYFRENGFTNVLPAPSE